MLNVCFYLLAAIFLMTLVVGAYRVRKDMRFDQLRNVRVPWYKQPAIIAVIASDFLLLMPLLSLFELMGMWHIRSSLEALMFVITIVFDLLLGSVLFVYSFRLRDRKQAQFP